MKIKLKSQNKVINIKEKEITLNIEILNKSGIDNIINNDGKIKLNIFVTKYNFETTYTFKNKTTNIYYFQCDRRPKCIGKAKCYIIENKFFITEECDPNSSHNILTYNKLKEMIENNNLNKIDFIEKKSRKYY